MIFLKKMHYGDRLTLAKIKIVLDSYNMILYIINMIQKYYSIDEQDFGRLVRLANSQHRNPSEMVRIIIVERLALCEEEKRDTGTTSLLTSGAPKRRDDDIENMLLYPMQ